MSEEPRPGEGPIISRSGAKMAGLPRESFRATHQRHRHEGFSAAHKLELEIQNSFRDRKVNDYEWGILEESQPHAIKTFQAQGMTRQQIFDLLNQQPL